MTRPSHSIAKNNLIWLVILVMMLAIPAIAGVSLGPVPKDADEAEQRRVMQFYEAQKSEQKKLEVGRERYNLMLTNRAHVVAAMVSELAIRQQLVTVPSTAAAYADIKQANTWTGTTLGVAAIIICFLGFRYYLRRQNLKEVVSRKR